MPRGDLSNEQWQRLEPLLTPQKLDRETEFAASPRGQRRSMD